MAKDADRANYLGFGVQVSNFAFTTQDSGPGDRMGPPRGCYGNRRNRPGNRRNRPGNRRNRPGNRRIVVGTVGPRIPK